MKQDKLIELLHTAEQLKNNLRHSWTSTGRQESVAEHTYRLMVMAYFTQDEFPEADYNKILKMCLFHDWGEAFTGDIPAFHKTREDEMEEARQLSQWLAALPEEYRDELTALFREMEEQQTIESKIYKALDKMECLVQHNEADVSTWLPLEYDLNLVYGKEQTAFSPYMEELRQNINAESIKKLQEKKKE